MPHAPALPWIPGSAPMMPLSPALRVAPADVVEKEEDVEDDDSTAAFLSTRTGGASLRDRLNR